MLTTEPTLVMIPCFSDFLDDAIAAARNHAGGGDELRA
jgi:hypothetical protein